MNRNGRIVGGVLVGLAALWLLRIIGALPFSDRSVNQAVAQIPPDRPPIADFDASRSPNDQVNPPTTTQPFLPGDTTPGGGNTPGNGSPIADSTQPGTGTEPDTTPINPSTTRPIGIPATPVVRGAW